MLNNHLYLPGMCVDLATQITMYIWSVDSSKEYVLYILSGMWGMTDVIWKTQINGKDEQSITM